MNALGILSLVTPNDASLGIIICGDDGHFLYALAEPGLSSNSTLVTEGLVARVGLWSNGCDSRGILLGSY